MEDPSTVRGMSFASSDGWELSTYDALARQARSVAAQVREQTPDGGVVVLVLPTGPDFVASFFGVLWAGRTPCPVAPPAPLRAVDEYHAHAASVISSSNARLVLASGGWHAFVRGAVHQAGTATRIQEPALGHDYSLERQPAAPLALLQFTSGSTGASRGVRVTPENLAANVEAGFSWAEADPSEEVATWLPLFHDMGLIGMVISPVTYGMPIRVLSPEQFIRNPSRWLDCFGRLGSSITAAPSFGFGHAANRVTDEELEGTDFSGLRVAICASERVDVGVLGAFRKRLAPYGFKSSAFLPAYGLAESTLTVTGTAAGAIPHAARIDWCSLEFGAPVAVLEQADLQAIEGAQSDAGWLVGCGRSLDGAIVEIADANGAPVGPGRLGEIVVRGAAVADGYVGDANLGSTRFQNGTLRTADAGFLLDGELFVIGRMGDSVSLRGRTIFAEDLEARLAASAGLPRHRTVVLAGVQESAELVVLLVEIEPGEWAQDAASVLTAYLGRDIWVQIGSVRRGGVHRTTSGKPRRRPMWNAVTTGELAFELLWQSNRPAAAAAAQAGG